MNLSSVQETKMNLGNYLPNLNFQTVEFLKRIITSESLVFETGSGNSTIWFGKQVKRVVALENDEAWYKKVQQFIEKERLQNVKLYFEPDYPKKQFKDILQNEDIIEYDIVLHDGPYSVGLRISAMKFMHSFVKPSGYLVIDDTHKSQCSEATKKYLNILRWKKLVFPYERDAFRRKKSAFIYQRPLK